MRPACVLVSFAFLAACSSEASTQGILVDAGVDATLDSSLPPRPEAGSGDASFADVGSSDGAARPDADATLVDAGLDAPTDAPVAETQPPTDASITHPCDLPGSIRYTASGVVVVPGGASPPLDLMFLHVPVGFCVHYFGTVGNARQLRFAPGGELFVASPTTGTTGGGGGGQSAIVVLPDDNHDGVADAPITFFANLPSTQGLLFTANKLFYQDATTIRSVPYKAGDRAPSAASTAVADITYYSSALHWPKTLDAADDGTIYVGNGGDQGEACDPAHPFHGGILKLDGTPGGAFVEKGFRNPIAVRCSRGHDLCFAIELSKDYSAAQGGREKLVPIHQGDDLGFPCCATSNLPYPGINPTPDCSTVTADTSSFVIGDTPFGVDFEPGIWPAPFGGSAFVATHGAAGTWTGARLVRIAVDPSTGLPLPSTNKDGTSTGAMSDFGTGWDDGTFSHGRPAAVTFSSDGRLFVSNDHDGSIAWIAPLSL